MAKKKIKDLIPEDMIKICKRNHKKCKVCPLWFKNQICMREAHVFYPARTTMNYRLEYTEYMNKEIEEE